MKTLVVVVLALALIVPASAQADPRLLRFEGGIGVIPTSRVDPPVPPATVPTVVTNVVRGIQPGGQPWVIAGLKADIRTDGQISVDGRGLLLAGGPGIGTNGAQIVRAILFCGPAATATAHESSAVPLAANGDFQIDSLLSPAPPVPCDTPVLLIVSNPPANRWFAAGILKD